MKKSIRVCSFKGMPIGPIEFDSDYYKPIEIKYMGSLKNKKIYYVELRQIGMNNDFLRIEID